MNRGIEITVLKPEQIDEAVEVMLNAFKDEAITSAWMDLRNPKLKRAYSVVVKIIYTIHLDAGDPIYIALEKERIAGLAGLTTPEAQKSIVKSFKLFIRNLPRLLPIILPAVRAIRMLYRATKPPADLPKNYCTLEVLAVDPGCQGRGIASQLLRQIELNHLAGNKYSGIYLLTGEAKNVSIYEHFGYKVVEKRTVQNVNAYHMFKAKIIDQ